jgi:hypothetical protein
MPIVLVMGPTLQSVQRRELMHVVSGSNRIITVYIQPYLSCMEISHGVLGKSSATAG